MKSSLKEVTDKIKGDKDLYYAYQSNIAMSFVDECRRLKKIKGYLTNKDIHMVANQAAQNFLDLWVK